MSESTHSKREHYGSEEMVEAFYGKEYFTAIDGFDGKYLISTWGRVYSFNSNKFLIGEINEKGYCRVTLSKNGKHKHYKVHRLVAEAFIPNPYNKPQVNHKDGNKLNNSIANLEWVTNQENQDHRNKLCREIKEYE